MSIGDKEFAAALVRERIANRCAVATFVTGVGLGDLKQAEEGFRLVCDRFQFSAAWKAIARLPEAAPSIRDWFLEHWIEHGDGLRTESRDLELLSALAVLLPPYQGPAMQLFRGDGFINRRRRTYGMSWSSERVVADAFARSRANLYQEGSVLITAEVPANAIVCAVPVPNDHYKECEYIVDRRRLETVQVEARYHPISAAGSEVRTEAHVTAEIDAFLASPAHQRLQLRNHDTD